MTIRLVVAVLVLGLAFAPEVRAGAYVLRKIALTGEPVPGRPGAVFQWFGAQPGAGDTQPELAANGTVSFVGGWSSSFAPHGLFQERDGVFEAIAVTGDPAEGTPYTFAAFPSLITSAARLQGGFDSFDASVVIDQAMHFGIWVDRDGQRSQVLDDLTQPPGTPAGSRFFNWFHTLGENGAVLVNAKYSQGSSSEINDQGFWRDRTGALEVVALARAQAPGTPAGVLFGNQTGLRLAFDLRFSDDSQGLFAATPMALVGTDPSRPPTSATLSAAPNPFRRVTTVGFELPARSEVRLTVHDLAGRRLATLRHGILEAGRHQIAWDADREPAGVYFVRMVAGERVATSKLLRIE
jgi:hypothetical protein